MAVEGLLHRRYSLLPGILEGVSCIDLPGIADGLRVDEAMVVELEIHQRRAEPGADDGSQQIVIAAYSIAAAQTVTMEAQGITFDYPESWLVVSPQLAQVYAPLLEETEIEGLSKYTLSAETM